MFKKGKYNAYRRRHYNLSESSRKEYVRQMEKIEQYINSSREWSISTMLDSAYRDYGIYMVRLSNHSADNQYHDLHSGELIVNIKSSKLNFINKIENEVDEILSYVDMLDLSKYRFINVVNGKLNCFYKGFKTKKDVVDMRGAEQ